jgi:subfamily B ATP-binding cassette protein MsbA
MGLGLRFFQKNSTGALMSRVMSDVGVMQNGVANVVTSICRDGFSAISLLVVIFYRSWQLALITFIVIPLTVFSAQKIGKRIKRLSGKSQEKIGDVASLLQETFSGIKVVKAFGLGEWMTQRFHAATTDYYIFIQKAIKYGSISTPVIEMITSLGIAGVIWVGGSMVMSGKLTSAEFFSFLTAMVLVYKPIKSLNNSYNIIQASIGAAVRVFEIIDEKPEICDAENVVSIGRVTGDVEFRDVSFAYDGEMVINHINLSARHGEIIALVGPSGGGKSTLVSLIPRFYDVSGGAILFDGVDIRAIGMKDLIRQVALVDQETMLFNDTIANNIRYGNFVASDAEVESAARAAFAHDFITEMPEGYATTIGDRGIRLSGGQRQRLCIARALIKNAPILILDEATSALDTESEQMVQQALNNLMTNRTTFVIAHRLSTILHADKILVLENGRIVESGSHKELLENSGLYSRLCSLQFGDSDSNASANAP